ncbi:MAG: hypothetical protein M1820_009987 [Bogoriella megaspora]|nr:MAG: hypothetical protein M1820_009987 [Bogoriella megaspora]
MPPQVTRYKGFSAISATVSAASSSLGRKRNCSTERWHWSRERQEDVEWECERPVIFAYQLEKLKRKKQRWVREPYNKGAFMEIEKEEEENGLEQDDEGILGDLDPDEVEVRNDGWDDLDEGECVVVVSRRHVFKKRGDVGD